ncbi:MAG TPA: hypothetical protein VGM98_12550 [Schlesneria sp.]|jgi:hypothetical protein
MWQVKLTRGNLEMSYQYETQEKAEDYAKVHRSTGYYEVTVSKI